MKNNKKAAAKLLALWLSSLAGAELEKLSKSETAAAQTNTQSTQTSKSKKSAPQSRPD